MYTEKSMLGYFILFFILGVISSVKMLYDYNKKGKLTLTGSIILLIWFCEHGILLDYSSYNSIYQHPENILLKALGIILIVFGLIVMVLGMVNFGKFTRTMGTDTKKLITGGLYKFTRNPQYVGYGIAIIGFNIAWYTILSVIAVITYFIMIYITIIIEEKNLLRIYGKEFEEFCTKTPRFI